MDTPDWRKDAPTQPTQQEKYLETIKNIEKAIEEDPTDYNLYFMLSFVCDRAGLYQKSLEALKKNLRYYPEDGEAKDTVYGNIARTYLILEQPEKAKAALDKAMKINPENLTNLIHLVTYYLDKKDIDNTASTLKKISDLNPQGEQYHAFFQQAVFDLGADPSTLIAIFEKVIEIDPDNYEAYKTYATVLRHDTENLKDNFSLIEKNHKKAIELAPDNIYNYISFGNAYWMRSLLEEERSYYLEKALTWLKKAKEIDPHSPNVAFSLGNCYLHLSQHDKAIKNLEHAMKGGSISRYTKEILASAYSQKAESLYEQGKVLPAYEFIKKAIDLDPNNAEIFQRFEFIGAALGKEKSE